MPNGSLEFGRTLGQFLGGLRARASRSSDHGYRAFSLLLIATVVAGLIGATFPSTSEAAEMERVPPVRSVQMAPANATCVSRPRVSISSTRQSGGLAVTISSATSAEVPNNRLSQLRTGIMPNSALDIRGRTLLSNNSIALPDRPVSISLFLRRTTGSGSITAPMVIVDDCGDWTTFVGGGSTVFNQQDPSPPPASNVGVCGESMTAWHGPLITNAQVTNCQAGHEHGDAPPSWISQAGYNASFVGAFNTSAQENTAKHAAMKGFLARFSNVDIYFRPHAASNVLDRSARFHSYEVWARDASGGVSHWQGWYNTGDPVADRVVRTIPDPLRRPIMLVVDQASWDAGIRCEQWYGLTSVWSWDFGWTICEVNTLFYPGENSQLDQSFWRFPPGGARLGGTRRLEAAWYQDDNRPHPVGEFWATQLGDIVTGPNDSRCSGSSTRFGVTYANVCLRQFIASTMTEVAFPGNAVQKVFPTTGVRAPN
jgi:hypothetical protein